MPDHSSILNALKEAGVPTEALEQLFSREDFLGNPFEYRGGSNLAFLLKQAAQPYSSSPIVPLTTQSVPAPAPTVERNPFESQLGNPGFTNCS